MAAKTYKRINYKSDFLLSLESDAGWLTPFCIKFWTGAPSVAYYASFDGTTYTHCAPDQSDPTKLTVQFDDHHLPCGELKYQIAYHFTVADFPDDTEDEVINQADIVVEIDGQQYYVMLDFNGETAPDIMFALPAYANEATRIANEQQRIANEQQRISNEETRQDNEATRQRQEQSRQEAEAQRGRDYEAAEAERNRLYGVAETERNSEYDTAEAERNRLYGVAESGRDSLYETAEGNRGSSYTAAEAERDRLYGVAESGRDSLYETAEGNRGSNYTAAEAERDRLYGVAESERDSSYATEEGSDSESVAGDGSRWGAYKQQESLRGSDTGIFDISTYNLIEGQPRTYASLSDALGTNGTNIPQNKRKGGMTVKYIDSTKNEYVQYRLMSTTFSTTVGNWQGIDSVPTAGSENLVQSGGVHAAIKNNSIYDISINNSDAEYADLAAALGASGINVPADYRKGGMSICYKQIVPATYRVVVTEADTQPTGTALLSSSSVTTGTYTASQLSDFSTLPTAIGAGNALTYYYNNSGTYTVWTIGMFSVQGSEYVQYRLMKNVWSATVSDWQGIDKEPLGGSKNLIESNGIIPFKDVIDFVDSPNLFDKTRATVGKTVKNSTGATANGGNYFCTDYIPIDSAGTYASLAATSSSTLGHACYDINKVYTHGENKKTATWHDAEANAGTTGLPDAFVRYNGLKSQIDSFMVVRGTSADYPSTYVSYGKAGVLKPNTVSHDSLLVESVNEDNLSERYWIYGKSVYGNTVKEIFFLDKAIPEGASMTGHFYGGRVIFTCSLNGSQIWSLDRTFAYNYLYNNVVYALKCSTSSIETISAGDIVGYIVFADVSAASAINDGNNRTVYIPRVKYLLNNPTIATQTYNIKEGEISTSKIAKSAVTLEKIEFRTIEALSNNVLNTEDANFKHQQGFYINYSTGATGYSSTSPSCWGYTGFIPVSSQGLHFNAFVAAGVFAGAVYNKNKQYIRALRSSQYTYQEGDAYVRWTLAQNPISPYTEGQYMVWIGDGSVRPEYDEYEARDVIDPAVLPSAEATVKDGSITEAKLSQEVKNSIVGTGVELCIPDVIPCVVGDTLRIYFRSIVKAPNPYIWDLVAVSSVGKCYPRYYEYKPTAAGNKTVTFYVRNSARSIVAQKAVTIKCITAMSSPASNKNILMIGASMLADGNISYELNRRLTSDTGDGTPLYPTGIGLNNITFVGRKTGSEKKSIHQEGNSGWSWKDYATIGRYAYRFFVVGQVGIDVQPGAVYSGAGTLKFTVSESDIDIDRATGTGYFTCTYSGSGTQPASGTLTLYSGEGDATITYDSFNLDSGNPFWNDGTNQLDFITYANSYCNGSIDVLISFTAMNDFTAAGNENGIAARIENYVKPFIRAFHEQFPDSIVVLCTMYLGSVSGGMAVSYGASGTWNYYNVARMTWKWSELVRELAADDEFSSYVKIIDTNSSLDCENLYSTTPRAVANRSDVTEIVQTNGVHTTVAGKETIADSLYEGLNDIMGQ